MVTYHDLGVRPFINASGTITTLGGSLMDEEVLQAMQEAASSFIDLGDLNEKAGEYLARRIGVEAAFVSCGAASGMQLSAAACLTGVDRARVAALPHTEGWKNEFIISMVDAHTYIHQGIEVCGGHIVRVGSRTSVTTQDLVSGISERTCAVVHFLGKQTKAQLAEVIAGAEAKGVPVIVDAAAQLPPRANLVEIVNMGASLVTFSGGKGLCGPQNTGLVVGKKGFVEAAALNGSPNSAIGRGMKVGKEEILGLVTAIDLFLRGSDEEDRTTWAWRAAQIVTALEDVPGVTASVRQEGQEAAPEFAPRAYIELADPEQIPATIQALRSGETPVVVRRSGSCIIVDPMTLKSGEEEVVAEQLRRVLEGVS